MDEAISIPRPSSDCSAQLREANKLEELSMTETTRQRSVTTTSERPSEADLNVLADRWRSAPRRWGHPLHSICSYFAMFPPQLAHFLIDWLTSPGDVVYDPFAGRGTVPLEAALLGRTGHASDANPLAAVLSSAKVSIPTGAQIRRRLDELEKAWMSASTDIRNEPPDIRMLYSDCTLRQLVFLKRELDRSRSVDTFIMALVLGMLHANHSRNGATRGFSISMPNTFAMAPGYVRRYIDENGLVAPNVDVFAMLRTRVQRLALPDSHKPSGRVWLQDATIRAPAWLRKEKARLVLTSPPYLQVIKYGKYNWVRLWFLDQEARAVDDQLMASSSLKRYSEFMGTVCKRLAEVVTPDGYVCLVIGDVRRGNDCLNLAETVWERAIEPLGWQRHAIVADELPEQSKVSRIWKNNSGRATKTDRILILSPQTSGLPALVKPSWEKASRAYERSTV